MSNFTPRDLHEAELFQQQDLSSDPFGLMPSPAAFEDTPHPRVLCTCADIARVRDNLSELEWLQRSQQRLIAAADAPVELPEKLEDGAASHMIAHAERGALASLLTDEPRYAEQALKTLLVLARSYTQLPVDNGCRFTANSLSESHQLLHLARACDLVFATGISEEDTQLLRTLLQASYEVIDTVGHRTCGNHNTWAIAARLATASALGDRQGLHDALYGHGCPPVPDSPDTPQGRYGLVHQLRHDFLSDGLHWERTVGYHFYSLMAFTEAAMMLANIGVDVWHAELPSQAYSDGYDVHRAYGPEGTKTFKAAFDAPLYLAFANGDLSLLHDSGLANLRGIPIWGILYEAAFDAYRDPKYAWLLEYMEQQNPTREYPGLPVSLQTKTGDLDFVRLRSPEYSGGAFALTQDSPISIAGQHQNGCTLFPITGVAVLRSDATDKDATGAQLFWGPHSAGHQNPASLHLDVHAGDRFVTGTPVTGGYEDATHATWARTTIAHNTVTVAERPMFPYDLPTESIWEADNWRGCDSDGVLQLFQPESNFKVVRASNQNVYPGVRLDRTVVLTHRYLLDVFRVLSDGEHQYDWAWHGAGNIENSIESEAFKFDNNPGYQHLSNARVLQHSGDWPVLSWNDGRGYTRGQIVPPPGAQLIVANTPAPGEAVNTYGHDWTCHERSSLIVRTKAAQAVFLSLWSFGSNPPQISAVHGEASKAMEVDVRIDNAITTWYLPFQSTPVRCANK